MHNEGGESEQERGRRRRRESTKAALIVLPRNLIKPTCACVCVRACVRACTRAAQINAAATSPHLTPPPIPISGPSREREMKEAHQSVGPAGTKYIYI